MLLNSNELAVYTIGWTGAVLYSMYRFYQISDSKFSLRFYHGFVFITSLVDILVCVVNLAQCPVSVSVYVSRVEEILSKTQQFSFSKENNPAIYCAIALFAVLINHFSSIL